MPNQHLLQSTIKTTKYVVLVRCNQFLHTKPVSRSLLSLFYTSCLLFTGSYFTFTVLLFNHFLQSLHLEIMQAFSLHVISFLSFLSVFNQGSMAQWHNMTYRPPLEGPYVGSVDVSLIFSSLAPNTDLKFQQLPDSFFDPFNVTVYSSQLPAIVSLCHYWCPTISNMHLHRLQYVQ